MTAAVPNEDRPFPTWLAHHHLKIGVAGLAWFVIVAVLPAERWPLFPSVLIVVPAVAAFMGFFEGMRYSIRHAGLTCYYCMERITVNGAEEAQQRRVALRLPHLRWFNIAGFVVFGAFLLCPIPALLSGWSWLVLPAFPFLPYLVWTAYLMRIHSRLGPWCPDCSDGRGWGPREGSPDPRPAPQGVAS